MIDVGVRQQTQLLEGIEASIDGGDRQRRTTISEHERRDLIGSGVAGLADRVEHPNSLTGQALALGTQLLPEITHRSTVGPSRQSTVGVQVLDLH